MRLAFIIFAIVLAPFRALANGETISPNMNLVVPAVGVTNGPDWATDIVSSLDIIDAHNHCSGSGVQVPSCGIDINSDLSFLGNNATNMNSVVFGTEVGTPANLAIYSDGTDLYYKNASGTPIQITKAGGVNVSAGNIQNLPSTPSGGAGISWQNTQGTFQLFKDSGSVGANLDSGTLVIRYPGSYPAPSGNYIALQAPTSLASGFAFTLPATLPGSSGAFMTSSSAGALSYTNVDNSTLQITSSTLAVNVPALSGITGSQLANSTITGTNIASNINLPGNSVQENGNNVVVSSTNAATSIKIIRGRVNGAGSAVSGEGYSSSEFSPGAYTLTWTSAFADVPALVVTVDATGLSFNATTDCGSSTTSCVVLTDTLAGSASSQAFSFIAMGAR